MLAPSQPMRSMTAILLGGLAVYGGLVLYLFAAQSSLIYFPDLPTRTVEATPAAIGLPFEALTLPTEDGEQLSGWYIPAREPRATLLYLHGNGGNIGHRLDPIAVFNRIGLDVLIIDYRGYGDSTGRPSEEGTYADALAAWRFLTVTRGIPPQRIVLFGESLGGAVAAWLAAREQPAGLMLYASFTSVPDMAQALYPLLPARWLARYRYDTRAALADGASPLLILHSRDDELIPFSHGEALLAAARAPKGLVELEGGHNDALLVSRERYAAAVDRFLRDVVDPAGAPPEAAP